MHDVHMHVCMCTDMHSKHTPHKHARRPPSVTTRTQTGLAACLHACLPAISARLRIQIHIRNNARISLPCRVALSNKRGPFDRFLSKSVVMRSRGTGDLHRLRAALIIFASPSGFGLISTARHSPRGSCFSFALLNFCRSTHPQRVRSGYFFFKYPFETCFNGELWSPRSCYSCSNSSRFHRRK
jgi:hypothetical protein